MGVTMSGELTVGKIEQLTNQLPEQRVEIAVESNGVQLRTYSEMARFCRAIVNSGLAPKSFHTPEQVMVAIQHGLEIGLPPMQALQSIAVINGRPTIYGDAALALAMAHPMWGGHEESYDQAKETATCKVWRFVRVDDSEPRMTTRTFSREDAKRAGLWGKSGPWTQYPARMLQMRARAFALRDTFPDAIKGVGITEEVRDYAPIKKANAREVATTLVLPTAENTELKQEELI